MTHAEAIACVCRHGVVLESGIGPVPSLAEAVAGGPIRGSGWGHAQGREIFAVTRAVRDCPDVLVCRLVDGKITYVHRRLWPALVRLAKRFPHQFLQPQLDRYSSLGRGSSSLTLPSAKSDAVMVTPAGSSPIALPSPSNWPSSNRSVPYQRCAALPSRAAIDSAGQ